MLYCIIFYIILQKYYLLFLAQSGGFNTWNQGATSYLNLMDVNQVIWLDRLHPDSYYWEHAM